MQSIDLNPSHKHIWERLRLVIDNKRLPQAMLFVGPKNAHGEQCAMRLMAIFLCESAIAPCGDCASCNWIKNNTHPDICYLSQEGKGGAIKIDMVRELQQDVYKTPQRGQYRFIVITPAEKLNVFAVNALLKIIEEPPKHTYFFLLAEQISSMPATLVSRCQKIVFSVVEDSAHKNGYLSIVEAYPLDSPKAALFKDVDIIIDSLCALVNGKITVCSLAIEFGKYALEDLTWFMYILLAQVIVMRLTGISVGNSDLQKKLLPLLQLMEPVHLFTQLGNINNMMRAQSVGSSMNQTLMLEKVLINMVMP